MTFEALTEGIKRLIAKRRTASREEQEKINEKLDKLYDLKYLMLKQSVNQ